MSNTLLTCLQLFGIGASFNFAGPCFVICTPVIVGYIVGKGEVGKKAALDVLIFLSGRLLAYLALGFIAGISGILLKKITNTQILPYLRVAGGTVIILLGFFIWAARRSDSGVCRYIKNKVVNFGNLFVLGFAIGIFPCAPLLALLFEISLISETALAGAGYALSFGLGTFVAGFFVISGLTGILAWLPEKIFKSKISSTIFRAIYSLLFIALGVNLIINH